MIQQQQKPLLLPLYYMYIYEFMYIRISALAILDINNETPLPDLDIVTLSIVDHL